MFFQMKMMKKIMILKPPMINKNQKELPDFKRHHHQQVQHHNLQRLEVWPQGTAKMRSKTMTMRRTNLTKRPLLLPKNPASSVVEPHLIHSLIKRKAKKKNLWLNGSILPKWKKMCPLKRIFLWQLVEKLLNHHQPKLQQSVTVQGHKGQIEDLKKPNLNRKYISNNAELRPNVKDLQVLHHQGEGQLGLPDLKSQKIVPKEEPPKGQDMRNVVITMMKKILGLEPIPLMEVQIVLEVVVLKNHQRNQPQDVAGEILVI